MQYRNQMSHKKQNRKNIVTRQTTKRLQYYKKQNNGNRACSISYYAEAASVIANA